MRLSFGRALALSVAIHGALYGAGLGWTHWRRTGEGIEIDLAGSSLLPLPPNLGGRRSQRPPEDWVLGSGRKLAPQPRAMTFTAQAEVDAPAGPACPPPCPSNDGDWVPAGQTARKPEWASGFISNDDYPRDAKSRNQTGRVTVEVLIDASGAVRDVRLLQGSFEALNVMVLEKVRKATFKPAYDASGTPVPSRMTLPIVFELD